MNKIYSILAINPGSTSTKIAVYHNENCAFEEVIRHSSQELACFDKIHEQYDYRSEIIENILARYNVNLDKLDAIVGRGGPIKPIESGTYLVNNKMCKDLREDYRAEHASLLGGLIARKLADEHNIPAYTVDPVCVDELEPVARISGLPELPRISLFHALNLKAVARRAAATMNKDYQKLNLLLVHLGGGITVGAQKEGRMIDVNNANDSGPFSPERAGVLPITGLIQLCYSGKLSYQQTKKRAIGGGGLMAHLGTSDAREVEARINAGDEQAKLIYQAMAYNIAKEIGAMATVLEGEVDAIVLTGGLAYSNMLVNWIRNRVAFIAQILVFPGEDELRSLAEGALRVLRGEEAAKDYQ